MRTLKLTIAYDGKAYAGWQCQSGEPTVQRTLENAIEKVAGESIRVLASGRTDAGVHALGQVVGFRTECPLPPDVIVRALNANLPPDIAVLDAAEVPDGFHAIRDAVRKRYRYVIYDGPIRDIFSRHYAWHCRSGRLDAEAMRRAAEALRGTHDFSSFESSGAERKTSIRTVFDLSIKRGRAGQGGLGIRDWGLEIGKTACGFASSHVEYRRQDPATTVAPKNFITIEIEADGFLYNMVRAIVGTLVEVGRGNRPETWPGEVLLATDRRTAGPTAPPQGLFLVHVEY